MSEQAPPQNTASPVSAAPKMLALRAICKSVQSGDTVILRNKNSGAERVIHLAHIQAPRVGSRDRNDELYAVQARDFLRSLVVGKEVSFEISYTVPSSTSAPLEFGDVVVQKQITDGTGSTEIIDCALASVQAGASKVRESRNADMEGAAEQSRKAQLRQAEDDAKSAARGLWADEVTRVEVNYNMPDDPDAFLAEHGKGKKLDAVVEAVNNGSTVRARLQTGPHSYQIVNVA